nr:MAG TPA: tail assembly chaperone [Caudoviricetes sp.]
MEVIKSGLLEFPIKFDTGHEGILKFNPNDVDFYSKLVNFENNMKDIYEDFESKKTENSFEIVSILKNDTCKKIKELFNDVFGENASEEIFKYASPISFVDNVYYPYYFLNLFMPEVVNAMDNNNKQAKEKMEQMFKHTSKYMGKK